MSKFKMTVLSGVAMIYPKGSTSSGNKVSAGNSVDFDTSAIPAPQSKSESGSIQNSIEADKMAPAAGISHSDRPTENERTGIVQVSVETGAIKVRTYVGTTFSEATLAAGEKISAPMTDSNKITLSVYPSTLLKS